MVVSLLEVELTCNTEWLIVNGEWCYQIHPDGFRFSESQSAEVPEGIVF